MARYRHTIAAALAGLALAVAACGDNDKEGDNPSQTEQSPVNTDTPQNTPGTTAPPNSDAETRTTRTDGE
jgi:hypothetical protein